MTTKHLYWVSVLVALHFNEWTWKYVLYMPPNVQLSVFYNGGSVHEYLSNHHWIRHKRGIVEDSAYLFMNTTKPSWLQPIATCFYWLLYTTQWVITQFWQLLFVTYFITIFFQGLSHLWRNVMSSNSYPRCSTAHVLEPKYLKIICNIWKSLNGLYWQF